MSFRRRRDRPIDEFVLSRRTIIARVGPGKYISLNATTRVLTVEVFEGRVSWDTITFKHHWYFVFDPEMQTLFDGTGWDLDKVQELISLLMTTT